MGKYFYSLSEFVLRRVFWMAGGVSTFDFDRMPPEGAMIVASNHASYLDPIILGTFLPRQVNFMARETLFDNWLLGKAIGGLFAFPIDREGDSRKALRTFGERLEKGNAVIMFPEGTRTTTGYLQPLKPGVGMISVRYNAPILPTYVWGTYQSWPKKQRFPHPHRFKIYLGEPITPRSNLVGTEKKAEQQRMVKLLDLELHRLEAVAMQEEEPPQPLVLPDSS